MNKKIHKFEIIPAADKGYLIPNLGLKLGQNMHECLHHKRQRHIYHNQLALIPAQ
jgi:hypothetical protein